MIKRIVLTGEPGSGKTTVLNSIIQNYETKGYKVLVVPETATELITAGIKSFGDNAINNVDFQELVLRLQLAKEEIFERATKFYNQDIIIIYDRGLLDNRAYCSEEEFANVCTKVLKSNQIKQMMDKYDLVLDLVGKKEFYTLDNNVARSESYEQAVVLREKTLNSWLGHDKIKIILPKEHMEDKINEVLNHINKLLSLKQFKRQEKYLVDLKSSNLSNILSSPKAKIEQYYLMSEEDREKRIRKVTLFGDTNYYLSVFKIDENGNKLIVSTKSLDEKTYLHLLEFKDPNTEGIFKNRYYFNYNGEVMHLDIFDNIDEFGILEVDIDDISKIDLPNYLNIIDKVTNKEDYYNRNIASKNSMVLEKKR